MKKTLFFASPLPYTQMLHSILKKTSGLKAWTPKKSLGTPSLKTSKKSLKFSRWLSSDAINLRIEQVIGDLPEPTRYVLPRHGLYESRC